jgi:hypothetical protein
MCARLIKKEQYNCDFCGACFSEKKNLNRHINTASKCIQKRNNTNINCMWCNEQYLSDYLLNKHYKECSSNKEHIHIEVKNERDRLRLENNSLIEDNNSLKIQNAEFKTHMDDYKEQIIYYQKQIEDYKKQINDINNKLSDKTSTTNNTTNNNVTYNISLVCGKPLIISSEIVKDKMLKTCKSNDVLKGSNGLAKWFIKEVCTNEQGKICLQCTDLNRNNFRYINEEDETVLLTGDDLKTMLKLSVDSFVKTTEYIDSVKIGMDSYGEKDFSTKILDFKCVGNKVVKKIANLTTKNKLLS